VLGRPGEEFGANFNDQPKGLRRIAMIPIAEINLSPGGIISWIAVGLLSGWFAARVMKGGGFGLLGDMIVGLIGAVIGGLVIGLLFTGEAGFWGSLIVASCGACIFITIFRFLGFGRSDI
jgi:uncharacterized membrane protein YeaQ/YmgE (transglycosylase-associated protein family)